MLSIEYSQAFDAARDGLLESYRQDKPAGYSDLLRRTLSAMMEHYSENSDCAKFDVDGIESVRCGSYQGSLYFLIPTDDYSEDAYTASVCYGSCSGCDAFESCDYGSGETDYEGFVRLSLHLLQSLKRVE